jgi:death-on-curing protein
MTKFFTVEQVIEIHDAFLEDHGGLPGIRDKGLLISAIEMPRTSMFGEFLHKTIHGKAAAYLFHIVQNHPFNDGNKRTGALTTILFLEENGIKITFSEKDYEEFVINVAQGYKNKESIAYLLKHGSEKKVEISSHL